jgi:sulfopyruvate decarboxylase subunit beta
MTMSRMEALKVLYRYTENLPVISSCGNTSREWASLGKRDNHLYMVDTMGLTPSVAIGVALAIESLPVKKCIAIEGDGGVLMNPNALASASFLNPTKWLLIVFDNEAFASTGGQRSYASKINLTQVVQGFGLEAITVDSIEAFERALEEGLEKSGPFVIHAKINQQNEKNPFINDDPGILAHQFKQFIQTRRSDEGLSH